MSLSEIQPGGRLPGLTRDEPVVCVPVYGAYDFFVQCMRSVLAHTEEDIPVLVADDASDDPRIPGFLRDLEAAGALAHSVHYLHQPENRGFPKNVNDAFDVCAPADVVVVNSDCIVAEGWLDGLRHAAHSDTAVATASTLTNNGTILSVPERNRPRGRLPQDLGPEQAAAAVRTASRRIRPRIPTAIGHCFYVRRSALELVGGFDPVFSPGYGEEVDFSQRCVACGLTHVAADDVFVFHHGGATLEQDGRPNPVKDEHERLIARRWPNYHGVVRDVELDETSPLARALGIASRALRRPTATIDGRTLTPIVTGTQVAVLEMIAALWRTGALRLRVIVPPDLGSYARDVLSGLDGVELLPADQVGPHTPRTDLVHRPFQVSSPDDIVFLDQLGERMVISHQDMIGFHNPAYHPTAQEWTDYRRLTREALARADHVVFGSEHAARDAASEDLVEPGRHSTVHIGTDHQITALRPEPEVPRGGAQLVEHEYILSLGTDFRHKNRLFTLRLVEALQERHGWQGRLVLAGPKVTDGSSAPEEAEFLAARPGVGAACVVLPAVSEPEKAWLVAHARLMLYPTVYEGFGLVPFEAADASVPCVFAPQTSLAEVLPREAARIVPWDPEATSDRVIELLRSETAREDLLQAIRARGARFEWDATAAGYLRVYDEAMSGPVRPARAMVVKQLELERAWYALRNRVGEDALHLVGPGGTIPREMERPLLAATTRPALRRPLFAMLRAGYRLVGRRAGGSSESG